MNFFFSTKEIPTLSKDSHFSYLNYFNGIRLFTNVNEKKIWPQILGQNIKVGIIRTDLPFVCFSKFLKFHCGSTDTLSLTSRLILCPPNNINWYNLEFEEEKGIIEKEDWDEVTKSCPQYIRITLGQRKCGITIHNYLPLWYSPDLRSKGTDFAKWKCFGLFKSFFFLNFHYISHFVSTKWVK